MERSSLSAFALFALLSSSTVFGSPFDAVKTVTRRDFYQQHNQGEKELVKNPDSLLLEMGPEMLTSNYVFGSVITGVTDPTHEDMGNLKGSKFPTLIARLSLDSVNKVLNIKACIQNCQDPASFEDAYQVPVVDTNAVTGRFTVDFSKISDELDFVSYWTQAVGMPEVHQKLGSRTNLVEHNDSTLVFEIETAYDRQLPVNPYVYTVKSRWFLKDEHSFTPGFIGRFPTNGVGFFQTTPNIQPVMITRFSLTKPVHFYIKSVPPRYRQAFQDALDDWNQRLAKSLGVAKLIDYEFLETIDPRFNSIIIGDVRYNVIQWDLDNLATYGGLGPSVANPISGETFSSAVWIQGPTIEKIYMHWFKVAAKIEEQKSAGNGKVANQLLAEFYQSLPMNFSQKGDLSKSGGFDFVTLRPDLRDPAFSRDDFETPPAQFVTDKNGYDKYMYGYFRDMVSHEVGHNLGLRHNFRGNLGSNNSGQIGSVSRSVMEYLGKSFRYLDRVGDYDVMAIKYGYIGTLPTVMNWYCTDEDQFTSKNPTNSPECSQSDATNDPFAYFESNMVKVYADLVAPGSPTTSTWTITDLATTLQTNLNGMLGYAVSAPYTASQWTNFAQGTTRPTDVNGIETYTLAHLQNVLCPANEISFISQKTSPADQAATKQKINDYRKAAQTLLAQYVTSPVITSAGTQLGCVSQPLQ